MFFRIVMGMVPSLQSDDFLTQHRTSSRIKPKTFDNFASVNVIDKSIKKKFYVVPDAKTNQYKHSFFRKTVIEWNGLNETEVQSETVESFKAKLGLSSQID